jgi:hypothetical protein
VPTTHLLAALSGALALALAAGPAPAVQAPPPAAEVQHLFDIATTGGESASTWATLAYDRRHDELFTVHGGVVHVHGPSGMETFAFGGAAAEGEGEEGVGSVERLALLDSGEMLLLTRQRDRRQILRTDFRGERLGTFTAAPLPAGFERFEPDRLQVAGERVYLAESGGMRVVVTDLAGRVERSIDLAALVRKQDPDAKLGLSGFWADEAGTLVFTLPLAFSAWVVTPARELKRFGARGSSPGKFNVAGAVATDERGNVFVLDRLRSVVLIFDATLRFVEEFGYRGDGPTSLVAPYDLAVGNGKLFVSQARERGVKAFRYQLAPRPAGEGRP